MTKKICKCGHEMTLMGTYKIGVDEYWFCPSCCEIEETDRDHAQKQDDQEEQE